jgi:glutathione S-transferase
VPAKLYSLSLSHPGHAARLMLERKGIEHEVVDLQAGFHPLQLRAAGFRGGTVPALKLDGRRVQGSRRISRALEQLRPDPPLFPAARRAAVEEAEAWGEHELQPVPRRLFRWATSHDGDLRRWLAEDVARLPAPALMALGYVPLARVFARMAGASEARVRADIAELPGKLDRVDELIAAGTIGGAEPNAADFQIATTVRVLLAFDDLRGRVDGRPAAELAMRILPRFPGPIPRTLPAEWL